jgi:hypothetical protein
VLTVKCSIIIAVLLGVVALPLLCAEQTTKPPEARYYPLALGNVWTYRVHRVSTNLRDSTVEWRVTHAQGSGTDIVYQVWPKPMQADDEAMELAVTPQGIKENSSDTFIMKFPVQAGERWSQPGNPQGSNKLRRSFHVLSINRPCHVNRLKISDCITIEDEDEATRLRTVTTYGRDIGPVLYLYYREGAGKETLVQTVTLTAHKLVGHSCRNIANSPATAGQSIYLIGGAHMGTSRSAATKQKNTTEITPFMVKKAPLSRERSSAETRECS